MSMKISHYDGSLSHSRRTGRSQALPVRSGSSQRLPLMPLLIEVGRVKPVLEEASQRGPFAVKNRIPDRVAVTTFVDRCLAKNTFEGEAAPQGGGARFGIERVTQIGRA